MRTFISMNWVQQLARFVFVTQKHSHPITAKPIEVKNKCRTVDAPHVASPFENFFLPVLRVYDGSLLLADMRIQTHVHQRDRTNDQCFANDRTGALIWVLLCIGVSCVNTPEARIHKLNSVHINAIVCSSTVGTQSSIMEGMVHSLGAFFLAPYNDVIVRNAIPKSETTRTFRLLVYIRFLRASSSPSRSHT